MDSLGLIDRARSEGLEIRIEGDKLIVRGPRYAEPIAKALLEHKADVIAHLASAAQPYDLPDGGVRLLGRLKRGIEWLTITHHELLETNALHTAQDEQFCDMLDLWDNLEATLRYAYPEYRTCVLGQGESCPELAPVRCRSCSGTLHVPS